MPRRRAVPGDGQHSWVRRFEGSVNIRPRAIERDEEPSDEQLAVAAQKGCTKSFEQIVRRLQVPFVHFLFRHCGSQADAEDLAQDTFVRAHRSLDRYSTNWRFRTWLFTIAHRLSINFAERRRGLPSAAGIENVAAAEADASDVLAAEENRRT